MRPKRQKPARGVSASESESLPFRASTRPASLPAACWPAPAVLARGRWQRSKAREDEDDELNGKSSLPESRQQQHGGRGDSVSVRSSTSRRQQQRRRPQPRALVRHFCKFHCRRCLAMLNSFLPVPSPRFSLSALSGFSFPPSLSCSERKNDKDKETRPPSSFSFPSSFSLFFSFPSLPWLAFSQGRALGFAFSFRGLSDLFQFSSASAWKVPGGVGRYTGPGRFVLLTL